MTARAEAIFLERSGRHQRRAARVGVVALFLSSWFLARLFDDCQRGPTWEIPPGVARDMSQHGLGAVLAFIVGVGATARGWRWHTVAGRPWARWLVGSWIVALLAAFVIVVGHGGFHDAFRASAGSPLRTIGTFWWLTAASVTLFIVSWRGTRPRQGDG
jgi:hypothetical protein